MDITIRSPREGGLEAAFVDGSPVEHACLEPDLRFAFDAYLRRHDRSRGTRVKYGHVLAGFESWLHGRSPTALRGAEVDGFLQEWQDQFFRRYGREPSRASYRSQIAGLRAFYAWLERFDQLRDANGQLVANPMRQIVAPTAEQRGNDWLRPAEDAALLAAECSAQEKIAVWLLRWTGLRVGEATRLVHSDVDLSAGSESLVVRESKTVAGRRTIAIVPDLVAPLREWLDLLDANGLHGPATPLLATRNGTAMKNPYVWRLVKRAAFRANVRIVPCGCQTHSSIHHAGCPRSRSGANLSTVTPHTLRRTFGSYLLNRGLRLEVVSKLLGHASTTVTERAYAELLDETARRELFQALARTPERCQTP